MFIKEPVKDIVQKFKSLNHLEKVFLIFLLLSQIYYSYRYIFRLGSPLSPPGYQETPILFQIGKYLLVALFFLLILFLLKKNKWRSVFDFLKEKKIFFLVLGFVFYIGFSLFKFGFSLDSYGITQTTKMLFVIPVVFFLPFVLRRKKFQDFFVLFFWLSFLYHLIFEIVQLTLFFWLNRLPALTFSFKLPRFGAGWDDPNGFAAFAVFFFIALVLFAFKGKLGQITQLILISLSVLLVLLGYSLTAFGGLALASLLLFLFRKLDLKKIIIIALTGIGFGLFHYLIDFIQTFIEAKLASTADHLSDGPVLVKETALEQVLKPFLGAFQEPTFNENLYLQLFQNYGLVGLIIFVLILLVTLVLAFKGWKASRESFEKTFFLLSFIYLSSFCFMNLGIPFFQIFPLNLFVWVMMGGVWLLSLEKGVSAKILWWRFE